jgi:hypothetical protein
MVSAAQAIFRTEEPHPEFGQRRTRFDSPLPASASSSCVGSNPTVVSWSRGTSRGRAAQANRPAIPSPPTGSRLASCAIAKHLVAERRDRAFGAMRFASAEPRTLQLVPLRGALSARKRRFPLKKGKGSRVGPRAATRR